MTDEDIKTTAQLNLKPNKYFSLVDYPFLYQKRQIILMLKRARHVCGDDVGLGKTLCAAIHFTYLKAQNPDIKAIVLTERVSLKHWVAEFEKLTVGLKVKIITAGSHPDPVLRRSALRNNQADVIISTYSLVYNYLPYLMEGLKPRYVLYADEPNYFKNTMSQMHTRMTELAWKASNSYGLTATIIENRLEEAFGILRVVAPGYIPDIQTFEQDYCIVKKSSGRKIIVGYKNLDKFRNTIAPAYYGRLKTDPEVKQALPIPLTKDLPVELSIEQSKKVVEVMDCLLELPTGEVKQLDLLAALIRSQQMVNDPRLLGFDIDSWKLDALMESLENSLFGERVVIHSKFRTQIDRLGEVLKKKKMDYVRVTGAENDDQREDAKRRFISDGKDRVNILMMTKAGLKAMDGLQKAAHFIWFDLPWSYGHYRQGIGRIERTGSKHKYIGVYRILGVLHPQVAALYGSDETIDHKVLKVLEKKKLLFNAITGDATTIETSPNDYQDILNEIRQSYKPQVVTT